MKPPYRCPEPESLERLIGEAFDTMPGPDTIRLAKIGARLETGLRRRRWREFVARWWWVGLLAAGGATAAWWAARAPGPVDVSESNTPLVIFGEKSGAARSDTTQPSSTADESEISGTEPEPASSPIIDRRERS